MTDRPGNFRWTDWLEGFGSGLVFAYFALVLAERLWG